MAKADTTGNIFDELEVDQPDEFLARAKLLHEVGNLITATNLTPKKVATKLGSSEREVNKLISGQLSDFDIDTLLHYLVILGCEVHIKVKKPRTRLGIFTHKGRITLT